VPEKDPALQTAGGSASVGSGSPEAFAAAGGAPEEAGGSGDSETGRQRASQGGSAELEDGQPPGVVEASTGASPPGVVCFYWRFSKMRVGWWLGATFGSKKGILGFNPSESRLPPSKGWQIRQPGARRVADPVASFVREKEARRRLALPLEEVLKRLRLPALFGAIGPFPRPLPAADAAASESRASLDRGSSAAEVAKHVRAPALAGPAAYFGHFCTLLHLEFLTEVASVRRRVSGRPGGALQKAGWALIGLKVKQVVPPKRPPRGRGRGREEWGGKVTFHTPKGVSVERLRLRAGDSVVLSETSPLVDAASEGQVVLVSDSLIAVTLLAQPPEGLAARTWRVDKGSNRTSYLRQLDSLVKLCAPRGQGLPQDLAARGRGRDGARERARPRIFDLITMGEVGAVDAWVQGGYGSGSKSAGDKDAAETSPLPAARPPRRQPKAALDSDAGDEVSGLQLSEGERPQPAAPGESGGLTVGSERDVHVNMELEDAPAAVHVDEPLASREARQAEMDSTAAKMEVTTEADGVEAEATGVAEVKVGPVQSEPVKQGSVAASAEVRPHFLTVQDSRANAHQKPTGSDVDAEGSRPDILMATASTNSIASADLMQADLASPSLVATTNVTAPSDDSAAEVTAEAALAVDEQAKDKIPHSGALAAQAEAVSCGAIAHVDKTPSDAERPDRNGTRSKIGAGSGTSGRPPPMGGVEAVAAEEILGSVSLEKLQECEKDLANVPGLNESQRRAVRAALTRRCTVVQGPPGTGKTTASVQILRLWAKLGLGPILATADGNVAVDNIALGLANCGVDVVRVGSPAKVSASLEAFTLDAKVAQRRAALKQEREAAAAAEREARARRAAEEEQRRAECAACPAPCPALRN